MSRVGNTETFQTVELADVMLELGDYQVVQRPAHVLLKETAPERKYFYARLGWDLVGQSARATFDFRSMTPRLE